MSGKLPAVAITGTGLLLVWSGFKGVSITTALQDVITGKNPANAKVTNTILDLGSIGTSPSGQQLGQLQGAPAIIGSGNAGSSAAEYQAYAFSLFPQFGWGTDQQQPLVLLWNEESGWNPNAQNPSSAYGIAQFLDSTWGPYGPKTSNPALQIKYGLEYIRDRYGSPAAAYQFENSHSPAWY